MPDLFPFIKTTLLNKTNSFNRNLKRPRVSRNPSP